VTLGGLYFYVWLATSGHGDVDSDVEYISIAWIAAGGFTVLSALVGFFVAKSWRVRFSWLFFLVAGCLIITVGAKFHEYVNLTLEITDLSRHATLDNADIITFISGVFMAMSGALFLLDSAMDCKDYGCATACGGSQNGLIGTGIFVTGFAWLVLGTDWTWAGSKDWTVHGADEKYCLYAGWNRTGGLCEGLYLVHMFMMMGSVLTCFAFLAKACCRNCGTNKAEPTTTKATAQTTASAPDGLSV